MFLQRDKLIAIIDLRSQAGLCDPPVHIVRKNTTMPGAPGDYNEQHKQDEEKCKGALARLTGHGDDAWLR